MIAEGEKSAMNQKRRWSLERPRGFLKGIREKNGATANRERGGGFSTEESEMRRGDEALAKILGQK